MELIINTLKDMPGPDAASYYKKGGWESVVVKSDNKYYWPIDSNRYIPLNEIEIIIYLQWETMGNAAKLSTGQKVVMPEYNNAEKYASLPDNKPVSINYLVGLGLLVSIKTAAQKTANNISGLTNIYMANSIEFLRDKVKDTNPILIRIPVEILSQMDMELVSIWLNGLNNASNIYIELYSIEKPDLAVTEEGYSRYGLVGIYNKRFPLDRTKENTITLYAASPDIDKKDLQTALQISENLKNSLIVPVGMKDDATGLIRGTLFGFRLIYISRHKDDIEFIKATISDYRDLIASYGINPPDLKADDILNLFGSNIAKIVAVLMLIIKSLPIRPIPVDQIHEVTEKAKELILKSA